jgi:hypothetical protein
MTQGNLFNDQSQIKETQEQQISPPQWPVLALLASPATSYEIIQGRMQGSQLHCQLT